MITFFEQWGIIGNYTVDSFAVAGLCDNGFICSPHSLYSTKALLPENKIIARYEKC